MELQFKMTPKIIITVKGDTQTDVWEQLARAQEVFGNSVCKKCGGTELQFVVRVDKDENKYYEISCLDPKCRARLSFGCHKKGGGLFAKRQSEDEDGKKVWLNDGGWLRWNKEKQCNE